MVILKAVATFFSSEFLTNKYILLSPFYSFFFFSQIMFVDNSPNAEIKLIDFGLSKKYAGEEHLHDAVGTIYTMSPELLAGD